MITKDPLAGLKIKEPKPRPQPCWSPSEVEQILESCSESQQPALTILADSGLRIGELAWLTWDDIDFERNVLLIRPKEGWRPKSGDRPDPVTRDTSPDKLRFQCERRPPTTACRSH